MCCCCLISTVLGHVQLFVELGVVKLLLGVAQELCGSTQGEA